MTLQDRHAFACNVATHAMAVAGRIPTSVFLMWQGDAPRPKLKLAPWDSEAEKDRIIGEMRVSLDHEGIDTYSFVAEAWTVTFDPRAQPERLHVPVREQTGRQDILLVITQHRNGEQHASVWLVSHQPDGPPKLSPREDCTDGSMGGFLGNVYAIPSGPMGNVHTLHSGTVH